MPYITVFTPVYNRAHTLDRLYNSLKQQTFTDFEWLIVDDGSNDNSINKIVTFQEQSRFFDIKFIQNNHGGKHRAVNTGLEYAEGRLFFMLDSDDWLTTDALEKVVKWESSIPTNSKCAGLCGCMKDHNSNLISRGLSRQYIFMPLTRMIKNGIAGDHADILYTEVFKKYPYPEIANEYHIAPGVPFIRMANDGYNLLFFNEVIYIAEYGSDGLTAMGDKKLIDNFQGYTLRTKELLESDIGLKRKIELMSKYSYIARKKNISFVQMAKNLNQNFMVIVILSFLAKIYFGLNRVGLFRVVK